MQPRTFDPRTTRLRAIMARHHLTARDVAELIDRETATVKIWRVGKTRIIPAHTLEVLEARLAVRGVAA